jgi:hypothetical protein
MDGLIAKGAQAVEMGDNPWRYLFSLPELLDVVRQMPLRLLFTHSA